MDLGNMIGSYRGEPLPHKVAAGEHLASGLSRVYFPSRRRFEIQRIAEEILPWGYLLSSRSSGDDRQFQG